MTIFDRETADAVYRRDFGAFACAAMSIVNPGSGYQEAWHVEAVTWELLQMWTRRGRNQLVINLPPRVLKSTIASIAFPAWLLGQDPTLKIICVSYEDGLAKKFSRETKTLMESAFYRRLFPRTILSARKSTETEFETTAGGYRFATSVGGSLTGRGADFMIIDDVIKPSDADSEIVRNKANEWFDKTAMSRREHMGKSRIIVVMQRVHENDLSGVLLEKGWPRLIIPAIAPEKKRYALGAGRFYTRKIGELLQPKRDRLEYYESLKAQHGSHVFSSQYQQDPVPAGGNIVKKEWLAHFEPKFARSDYRQVALTCDPAGKPGEQNDYTVIAIGGVIDKTLHLLEVVRGHWTIMQMEAKIRELTAKWSPNVLRIEDTSAGTSLIQILKSNSQLNVLGVQPKDDKVTRLMRHIGSFEAGRILFPNEASWLAEFEHEILAFPSGRYDDQVDAVVMMLDWFATQTLDDALFAMPVIISIPRDRFGFDIPPNW